MDNYKRYKDASKKEKLHACHVFCLGLGLKRAGGRNRTRPGGRNRTRNVRSSFTTGGRNRTRMCQKRDRRGTLERVESEREGVKTERGVHFLWQAQACGSVTCKEMVRYYFTFYVYVTGGALWEG